MQRTGQLELPPHPSKQGSSLSTWVQPRLAVMSPQSPLREVAASLQASDCLPVVDDHFRVRQPQQVEPEVYRGKLVMLGGREEGAISSTTNRSAIVPSGQLRCQLQEQYTESKISRDDSGDTPLLSCSDPATSPQAAGKLPISCRFIFPCSWWACCLSAIHASRAQRWR